MSRVTQVSGTMTTERLGRFFDACNAHDIDGIAGFFTSDGTYHASIGPDDDGTTFQGVEEVRRGFTAFFGTYPDGHYTEIRFLVQGNSGVARWTFTGSTRSGSQITYRGIDFFEFVGDRIHLKDAFRKERSAPLGS